MVTFGMVFYHGYYPKSHLRASRQANQLLQHNRNGNSLPAFESPLLIFTCNRDNYLRETLTDIQKYIPKDCSMGCPVVISQDGSNPSVVEVIHEFQLEFAKAGIPVVHLQHAPSNPRLRGMNNPYHALAVHYGWALGQVFAGLAMAPSQHQHPAVQPQRVLILEEDLHISPDFFDYFRALAPVLDKDATLLAISAFNDNGYSDKVHDGTRLFRSDFFPGLGWLMTRRLWDTELSTKWPTGYWDDWLRDPAQRRDRHIIRPEISRTFHFGTKGGASGNQFGDQLNKILLNKVPVDWSSQDLSYLGRDRYDQDYWQSIQEAQPVISLPLAMKAVKVSNVRLEYSDFFKFQLFAESLSLMTDEKAGVPRTAYYGVVETRPLGNFILYLTPPLEDLKNEMARTKAS
jgi:alpha-1,3-mannosyl-glycoprotein beta-1,2-N-acetylglucosaminyltransferase